MFKVNAYGRIARYTEAGVLLHVPHHTGGHGDPVVVRCCRERELLTRAQFAPGDPAWVSGDAYQVREDGLLHLAIAPGAVATQPPNTPKQRHAPLWCTVHARISSDVVLEEITEGSRAGALVCWFSAHVQVPEMPRGVHVVLRCRQEGEQAPYLAKHRRGDRVNMEGDLLELRFNDATGHPRRAHQLRVRRWWYAKDRPQSGRVILSERVPSSPLQSAPVLRGGGD